MCGIYGVVNKKYFDNGWYNKIKQRGPDNANTWSSDNGLLTLAHTRLAINDLSALGNQPFFSKNGAWVVTYNGEIYNISALRKSFPTNYWETRTDTEVLVELIAKFGIRTATSKLDGMFAFAAYNWYQNKLYLVRDRTGQKPLFYAVKSDGLVFSSSLEIFRPLRGISVPDLDFDAINQYFSLGFFARETTPYKNVHKLVPGSILEYSVGDNHCSCPLQYIHYSIDTTQLHTGSQFTSQCDLEQAIGNSVKECLVSDVPAGIFLSGGVDSTVVAAAIPEKLRRDVTAFSVGYSDSKFDETSAAGLTAKHLGYNFSPLIIDETNLIERIPDILGQISEPIADLSVIPLYLLSQHASTAGVKVVLTGDGGDELFLGYNRYIFWKFFVSARGKSSTRKFALQALEILLTTLSRSGIMGERRYIEKILGAMETEDIFTFYSKILGYHSSYSQIHVTNQGPFSGQVGDDIRQMSLWDLSDYLPNGVLVKSDRATMAASVEARSPLLTNKVIEAAFNSVGQGSMGIVRSKIQLRKLIEKSVPRVANDFHKKGFSVPMYKWLLKDLRPWAETVIYNSNNQDLMHLLGIDVREVWEEFVSGRAKNTQTVWAMLVFLNWFSNDNLDQING